MLGKEVNLTRAALIHLWNAALRAGLAVCSWEMLLIRMGVRRRGWVSEVRVRGYFGLFGCPPAFSNLRFLAS